MLSPDIALVALDRAHLLGWMRLLLPPALGATSWGLILRENKRALRAIVCRQGREHAEILGADAVPGFDVTPPGLRSLADTWGVGMVMVLDSEIVPALMAEIDGALMLSQDYVAQWLVMVKAIKRYHRQGIYLEPPVLDFVPSASYDALQATFQTLIPDDRSLLAYIVSPAGVDASVIAVKRRGDIVLATTHAAIADRVPERDLGTGWRRQVSRVNGVVAERFAPPVIAVYAEREAVRRILSGGDLAAELAQGSVVLDPAPAWLLALVGSAAAFSAAGRSAKALASMLPGSARAYAKGALSTAMSAIRERGPNPFAQLDFDPIALLRHLLRLYKR